MSEYANGWYLLRLPGGQAEVPTKITHDEGGGVSIESSRGNKAFFVSEKSMDIALRAHGAALVPLPRVIELPLPKCHQVKGGLL